MSGGKDLELDANRILHNFVVYPNVLRPERMVALSLAQYLYRDKENVVGKVVLDMGCGSGLQGIAMLEAGALHATFADLSPCAIENTRKNIARFVQDMDARTALHCGDLFAAIPQGRKFNRIVFNHPFFGDDPLEEPGTGVSSAMLDGGKLLRRFFADAAAWLVGAGDIIMPYFESAGEVNHPTRAKQFGYKVSRVFSCDVKSGLQRGAFSIYRLQEEAASPHPASVLIL